MTSSERSKEILRALSKIAKDSDLSINELRVVLALERIVARIEAHHILREKLIFKGGYVLLKRLDSRRFTRDLDALASDMPKEEVESLIKEALMKDLNDGVHFGVPEVQDLIDQGPYGGYRIKVPFQIGELPTEERKLKKLSRVHLDIGFGDEIIGDAEQLELSRLIKEEASLSWRVYPLESIFAEKLETLVIRGAANSRAKDIFDLSLIYERVGESQALISAIEKTFNNRGTVLPDSFVEFFDLLDFSIIERSWGSVELSTGSIAFDEAMESLRLVLVNLDRRRGFRIGDESQ